MREILFRGKRAKDNKWIYGFYVEDDADQAFIFTESLLPGKGLFHVKPKTIGQYIGLKDSAGKKIFEGDIVSLKGVYMLKSDEYETKVNTKQAVHDIRTVFCHYDVGNALENEKLKVTIIGNIHDNPELLLKNSGPQPSRNT
jgi:uncharacterized phage protein (TIGR01671 family)